MRLRTSYAPGPRTRSRRRGTTLVVVPAAVVAVAVGATLLTPQASVADERRSASGVPVVLDCLRAWVGGTPGAFDVGGVCDAARAELAARIAAPSSAPSAAADEAAAAASVGSTPSASATALSGPADEPSGVSADPSGASPSSQPAVSAVPSSAAPTAPAARPSAEAGASASTAAGTPAFGSRPRSAAITCSGQSGVVISGHTFADIRDDVPAITIDGCHDVVIADNDFDGDAEPIFVRNSTDVHILRNRYRDIAGPHERNGSHRGNFTQWENSFGGEIRGNSGIGGDTEDVVSIYKSGGTSASAPLVIADNVFQGTDWSSASGSGIMLGDGGGSHVLVKDNTLVDIGQVGIGVAGGSDIRIVDNTVVGRARQYSNVGIYAWGQGADCSDVTIARNRVDFVKADGTRSPLWDGGNCGPVQGLSTNDLQPVVDVLALLPKL